MGRAGAARSRRGPGGLRVLLVVLGSVPAAGADPTDGGRRLYAEHCLECHGAQGHGDGPKARRLGFYARDFSRSAFKCRSTATGELPTDEDLRRSIRRGLAGTPMPAHPDLEPAELEALVQVIKSFAPRFARDRAPEGLVVPPAPPPTPESVAAGREVYRLLQCWTCHGPGGGRDGPAARELKDDWGHPIRPGDLRSGRLKCGSEPEDLYRTLRTGITGSPMPSYDAAMLYGKEAASSLPQVRDMFGEEGAKSLEAYLAGEPSAEAILALPESEQAELVERRVWALVHYLRSLVR